MVHLIGDRSLTNENRRSPRRAVDEIAHLESRGKEGTRHKVKIVDRSLNGAGIEFSDPDVNDFLDLGEEVQFQASESSDQSAGRIVRIYKSRIGVEIDAEKPD